MEDINWKFLIIIHKKNKLLKWNRAWDFLILENAFLSEGITESQFCMIKPKASVGRLGGSVGWPSNFSSAHDLVVCEFEPHIKLCADCSKPGGCFKFCLCLSLPLPHDCSVCLPLSVSLSKTNIKIKTKSIASETLESINRKSRDPCLQCSWDLDTKTHSVHH